jgi:hypothetical protein
MALKFDLKYPISEMLEGKCCKSFLLIFITFGGDELWKNEISFCVFKVQTIQMFIAFVYVGQMFSCSRQLWTI